MRNVYALLAAVVALGLLSARSYLRKPVTSPFEGPLTTVLLSRQESDITLERRPDGSWTVTPPGDLADSQAASRLAGGLEALTFGDVVAGADAAAAYGLAVRARAGMGDVLFGRPALDGGLYAADGPGAPVRLARGPAPELLARSAEQWRERRALPQGCPSGAEVLEAGKPARRVPADDPLCALLATGFEPASAVPFGGFERPYLTVKPDGGPVMRVGARLSRRERAVSVEGRPGMLRVALDGPL